MLNAPGESSSCDRLDQRVLYQGHMALVQYRYGQPVHHFDGRGAFDTTTWIVPSNGYLRVWTDAMICEVGLKSKRITYTSFRKIIL